LHCPRSGRTSSDDGFRGEADQLGRICSDNASIAGAPTIFNFDVATFAPPGFLKCLLECRDPTGCVRIACSEAHQYTNAPHPLRPLRARRERPRCRAAEQRDELASPRALQQATGTDRYSINSSARADRVGEISRPSALALGCGHWAAARWLERELAYHTSVVRVERSDTLAETDPSMQRQSKSCPAAQTSLRSLRRD